MRLTSVRHLSGVVRPSAHFVGVSAHLVSVNVYVCMFPTGPKEILLVRGFNDGNGSLVENLRLTKRKHKKKINYFKKALSQLGLRK